MTPMNGRGPRRGGTRARVLLGAVLPVLALGVFAAGCSSGPDDRTLADRRQNYCTQLGQWQREMNEEAAEEPDPTGYDEVAGQAENVLDAMRPLRDEPVGGGRTLGEATAAAVRGEDGAGGLIAGYCDKNGFETLMR